MTYIEELKKRSALILESRAQLRGPAIRLYKALAQRWSQIAGVPISAEQTCLMLADMKIAREIYGRHDEDNVVDLVNYAYLYADLAQDNISDAQIAEVIDKEIDAMSRIKKGD